SQVAQTDPDLVTSLTDQRRGRGKHFSIDRKNIEIGHLQGIRTGCSGWNGPFADHQGEVPIDVIFRPGISGMDDEHSNHAHTHLRHLVMMRVKHLGAVLPQGELVFNCFSSFDVRLCEPTNAVHAIGKIKPMPVNGCGYSQPIRYIDSHPLAFDGLDRGAVHTAVESPTFGAQTRIEVMIDFLCDELKNFNAINDFKR